MRTRKPLAFPSRAFMAFAAMLASGAAFAQEYSFELKKKNPAALRAWQAIAPREYAKTPWIASLDGTTSPMQRVTLRGRAWFS